MLIKCPECELQVSDKALSCPHCGYPLKPEALKPRKPRQNKRKRLPNGFGQITELKGQALRKPFRAMVTVGKTPEGKPICKLLKPQAYFETYNDAYAALLEYNKSPFDLSNDITVNEMYKLWKAKYEERHQINKTYNAAWKYCTSVYDMPIQELRPRHIRYCAEQGTVKTFDGLRTPTENTKHVIKIIFNHILDYAVENDVIEANPAKSLKLDINIEITKAHMAFSTDEIKKLWKFVGTVPNLDIILIQCYCGCRPGELGKIETKNVHLKENYMVGGSKTKSGINRIIPIHPLIMPFIKKHYSESQKRGSEQLLHYYDYKHEDTFKPLTYSRMKDIYRDAIQKLNLNPKHAPHDGRKTFVTMAKENAMDEYAIKRIVGHKIDDLTENTYTERSVEWLYSEITKIK